MPQTKNSQGHIHESNGSGNFLLILHGQAILSLENALRRVFSLASLNFLIKYIIYYYIQSGLYNTLQHMITSNPLSWEEDLHIQTICDTQVHDLVEDSCICFNIIRISTSVRALKCMFQFDCFDTFQSFCCVATLKLKCKIKTMVSGLQWGIQLCHNFVHNFEKKIKTFYL